ncbi:MAG: hypothetical protein ACRC5T_03755 [Cetobacterium sp.]
MASSLERLVYPSVGIVERTDKLAEPQVVTSATIQGTDTIVLHLPGGSKESLLVKEGSIEPYTLGFVTFSTQDGGEYIIRPVEDFDGAWASKFKVALPPATLSALLTQNPENQETSADMPYLENEQEALIALKSPETEALVGLMYLNQSGAYTRINSAWVAISPSHTAFDGMEPYNVLPDTAQEFVDAFDAGAAAYTDVEQYLEPVK